MAVTITELIFNAGKTVPFTYAANNAIRKRLSDDIGPIRLDDSGVLGLLESSKAKASLPGESAEKSRLATEVKGQLRFMQLAEGTSNNSGDFGDSDLISNAYAKHIGVALLSEVLEPILREDDSVFNIDNFEARLANITGGSLPRRDDIESLLEKARGISVSHRFAIKNSLEQAMDFEEITSRDQAIEFNEKFDTLVADLERLYVDEDTGRFLDEVKRIGLEEFVQIGDAVPTIASAFGTYMKTGNSIKSFLELSPKAMGETATLVLRQVQARAVTSKIIKDITQDDSEKVVVLDDDQIKARVINAIDDNKVEGTNDDLIDELCTIVKFQISVHNEFAEANDAPTIELEEHVEIPIETKARMAQNSLRVATPLIQNVIFNGLFDKDAGNLEMVLELISPDGIPHRDVLGFIHEVVNQEGNMLGRRAIEEEFKAAQELTIDGTHNAKLYFRKLKKIRNILEKIFSGEPGEELKRRVKEANKLETGEISGRVLGAAIPWTVKLAEHIPSTNPLSLAQYISQNTIDTFVQCVREHNPEEKDPKPDGRVAISLIKDIPLHRLVETMAGSSESFIAHCERTMEPSQERDMAIETWKLLQENGEALTAIAKEPAIEKFLKAFFINATPAPSNDNDRVLTNTLREVSIPELFESLKNHLTKLETCADKSEAIRFALPMIKHVLNNDECVATLNEEFSKPTGEDIDYKKLGKIFKFSVIAECAKASPSLVAKMINDTDEVPFKVSPLLVKSIASRAELMDKLQPIYELALESEDKIENLSLWKLLKIGWSIKDGVGDIEGVYEVAKSVPSIKKTLDLLKIKDSDIKDNSVAGIVNVITGKISKPFVIGASIAGGLLGGFGLLISGEKLKDTISGIGTFGFYSVIGAWVRRATSIGTLKDGWLAGKGGIVTGIGTGFMSFIPWLKSENKFRSLFAPIGTGLIGLATGFYSESIQNVVGLPSTRDTSSNNQAAAS